MFKIIDPETKRDVIDKGTGKPMFKQFKDRGEAETRAYALEALLGCKLAVAEVPEGYEAKVYKL